LRESSKPIRNRTAATTIVRIATGRATGLHGGNAAPLAVELFPAREDGSGAEHHGQHDHGVRLGTADLPGMETA